MLLNSAYDAGWRTSVGEVIEHNHQLAIDIPEGKHHIAVRYWPKNLTLEQLGDAIGKPATPTVVTGGLPAAVQDDER